MDSQRHSQAKLGDTQFHILPSSKESSIVEIHIQLEEANLNANAFTLVLHIHIIHVHSFTAYIYTLPHVC